MPMDTLQLYFPQLYCLNLKICAISIMSVLGYYFLLRFIPKCMNMFLTAGFSGRDMSKSSPIPIPEAQGVLSGAVFLIILFLFMPIAFWNYWHEVGNFPHHELVEFLAALLSICCTLFLGFADDALNLRWRHKLILPTIASLPLLMAYLINFGSTTVIVPKPLRLLIGIDLNIGILYYIYMGMLAVFCTNAINIYAGINGIEVGQSIVIAISILVFNTLEFHGICGSAHQFSMFFMIPYLAVSMALYKFNKYPSAVFVGDTFCYFSGMTFAVVGILGHFSKTLLLFFLPQIVNFIYSVPQLFHFIPCPRHRLPAYNKKTELLEMSTTKFRPESLSFLGRTCFRLLSVLRLVSWRKAEDEGGVVCNNLTLINLTIRILGPINEGSLTKILLALQLASTGVAFFIRYPLAWVFFDV